MHGRYALSVETTSEVSAPLWRALRAADAPATVNELHRASRAHPNAIQLRLKRWERVGFVDVLPPEPARYLISERSAHLVKPPTVGSLSAAAWATLRRIGRPATFEELVEASGCSDRPLYCRLRRWKNSGHVTKIEAKPRRFALTSAAPDIAEPPRVSIALDVESVEGRGPSARERIWSVMRILKRFDLPMLMITAEANRRACEDFVNLLSRAGYVRRLDMPVRRRGAGNIDVARDWSTYVLVRNTGPRCPSISNSRERRLLDRNNGRSVPIGPGLRRRAKEAAHGL
jgi:hypothetical protein